VTRDEFERGVSEAYRAALQNRAAYCWRRERIDWWWVVFNVAMAVLDGYWAAHGTSEAGCVLMAALCVFLCFTTVGLIACARHWRRQRYEAETELDYY
jgi:uncharacterized membrane protein HdeD (DUF308 family)